MNRPPDESFYSFQDVPEYHPITVGKVLLVLVLAAVALFVLFAPLTPNGRKSAADGDL